MDKWYHKEPIYHPNKKWRDAFNADKPFQERYDMIGDIKDF